MSRSASRLIPCGGTWKHEPGMIKFPGMDWEGGGIHMDPQRPWEGDEDEACDWLMVPMVLETLPPEQSGGVRRRSFHLLGVIAERLLP